MSKRFARIALLGFVVALLVGAVPAVGAGGGNVPPGGMDGTTWTFNLAPGEEFYNSGILNGVYPTDYDSYTVICSEKMTLTVHIVDCCVTHERICYYNPDNMHKTCTVSPNEVWKDLPCKPGKPKTFHVGYGEPNAGGWPAGYDIWVTAP